MTKFEIGMVYKAVIFDLDDTLLDRSRTFEGYVPRFAGRYAGELGAIEVGELSRVILEADGKGYRVRDEMMEILRAGLPWKIVPEKEALLASYAEDFLACAVASEGMMEVIEAVRARGMKIGVVTNGPAGRQRRKLARLGIEKLIDVVVVSEEVGVKKPAREIYEMVLKGLGCAAAEVWFVGDHPENDVIGPEEMGMKGVWLKRAQEWPVGRERCGREIASLRELAAIFDF